METMQNAVLRDFHGVIAVAELKLSIWTGFRYTSAHFHGVIAVAELKRNVGNSHHLY